jgi:hypothetical protein
VLFKIGLARGDKHFTYVPDGTNVYQQDEDKTGRVEKLQMLEE